MRRALIALFFVLCCCQTSGGGQCCAEVTLCTGTVILGCFCSGGARPCVAPYQSP